MELPLSIVADVCVDNGLVMDQCDDLNIQQGDYIVQVTHHHTAATFFIQHAAILRGSHTTAKIMATTTFTVWNVTANNRSRLQRYTKREWRTFVDLPFLNFTALRRFPRAQESPSESRICSELPSESAQEPRSTFDGAFVVALNPFAFPAADLFPAVSSTVLGSSKRAGILGERCFNLVVEKDLPGLGRQAIFPALQSEQRHILISLPNLWQVFQETNHPFMASTTTIKEASSSQ